MLFNFRRTFFFIIFCSRYDDDLRWDLAAKQPGRWDRARHMLSRALQSLLEASANARSLKTWRLPTDVPLRVLLICVRQLLCGLSIYTANVTCFILRWWQTNFSFEIFPYGRLRNLRNSNYNKIICTVELYCIIFSL